MSRDQSTEEPAQSSGEGMHEPSFVEVVADAMMHSWRNEGVSGKLLVTLIVTSGAGFVACALYLLTVML